MAALLQATAPPSPPVATTPAPAPLAAAPNAVNLHPSQTQIITVTGANASISAQLDTALVTAAVDQNARTVTVTASAQTGRATLTVADSTGATVQVPIRVALDAGAVASSVWVRVTGNPIDPAWLQTQLAKAVTQAVQLQPGAVLTPPAFTLPASFAPGATAAVPVGVHIAGGDLYYDVDTTVSVNLQNLDVPGFAPALLFYDDDPEKILADGVLYRAQVSSGAPARLYYYHQNVGQPRRLLVVLQATLTPASVQLIDASAGPNIDVMTVGHNVSRDFLVRKPRNQGAVADLQPGTAYVADRFEMQHLDGAAGSVGINVLSGGPVAVTVLAVAPEISDAQIAAYLDGPRLAGDGHHRTGTFDLNGYADSDVVSYSVGGPQASLEYGTATPPAAQPSSGHDYGEYGVLRTLTFELRNPTAAPAIAYLYERPLGGPVRSSFLVDGALIELGCARLSQAYQIGPPQTLAAGSASRMVVQTMTDGGSNYPLEVGVTPAPPLPTTPPMSAPDGCFPKPISVPAPAVPAGSPSPVPEPTGRSGF